MSASGRETADRFDAVAVGIAQEGAVIGGVPERVDLWTRPGLEAPVAAECLLGPGAIADGQMDAVRMRRPRPLAIAVPVLAAADLHLVERLRDRIIEALGRLNVGHR